MTVYTKSRTRPLKKLKDILELVDLSGLSLCSTADFERKSRQPFVLRLSENKNATRKQVTPFDRVCRVLAILAVVVRAQTPVIGMGDNAAGAVDIVADAT